MRLSVVGGLLIGGVAAASVAVPGEPERALLAGAAVALGVWLLSWYVLASHQSLQQEARDLWSLTGGMSEGRLWLAPGGWALGADALVHLLVEMGARRPQTLVELGPGASSLILRRSVAPDVEMYGVEHDDRYAGQLQELLTRHHVENYTLISAALKQQVVEEEAGVWYDPAALTQLPESIDVLIVDGPPPTAARGATRAFAWPALRKRLSRGALVLVDDTTRPAERRMVQEWVAAGKLRIIADRGDFVLLETD